MQASFVPFDVLLTSLGAQVAVPAWMRPFSPRTVVGSKVKALHGLPALTVVEAREPRAILRRDGFLDSLARQQLRTPGRARILFVFDTQAPRVDAERLSDVLAHFSRHGDVEFARGAKQAELVLQSALAKIFVDRSRTEKAEPVVADPIGEIKEVIAATAPLRAGSGRLSARAVARTFGLSVAELAKLLGRSRQALSKTDDAESIQPALTAFARAARLRAVLPDDDFRAWLHMPNAQLDERQPIELIRDGRVEVIADLAENMLTGNPA